MNEAVINKAKSQLLLMPISRTADCDQPLRRSHPSIVWRRRWSVAYS